MLSTCTDVSGQRVKAEVGKKRQCIVHTGKQSQGPTGGAEQVSARSAITGAMNRECVEAADSSEMSAQQITVTVCNNPNTR